MVLRIAPLSKSHENCLDKVPSAELGGISQMQQKNMCRSGSGPVRWNFAILSWAKQFRLFPLDRNVNHLMLEYDRFPSVCTISLTTNKSQYDDRANHNQWSSQQISANFRFCHTGCTKISTWFPLDVNLTSSKNSQISENFLWFQPYFQQISSNFRKNFAPNFSTISDRAGGD